MVLFIGIILSLFAAVLVNFINKIKKQSEQLHQSESNLDSTIQNSAIGLAVVSLEGKWLRINQALTSMLGYSEEELLQTSFQEITHPDDIDTDLNNVEQLLSDSFKNYQMEKRYLHKNGHYIWAQLNVSLIRDKNGNPQHFISQIQDITDRLKIETERKEQARRFQAIFNQTFEFIWLLTTEGIVLEANRAALSTVDIKEGAVIGQTFWETPWWIHSPALQDRLKQAIKDANNGESVWFEATYPTPEGRIITVDFSLKPMKDENNKVVLLISEGRDITENREKELLLQKSEEKLVEAYTELESAYQSLEAQLQERKAIEKQLLQAQKMDAIGTLTGGIAHDFNNILWMILGNTEMLMSELENDTFLLETTTDIHDAALRAKGLVKQLLDFSRKSESEKVQFDAAPLIKETIKMLRSSIPTSIVINTNISPECGLIYGDANKFHQVIVNLCTNAFHAIADQGSISISTQKKYIALEDVTEYIFKKPGHFLMVEVCDTGCGMSAETIERIFEPFFTTKEVGKGTGLGLSTVHGIVEEMEGFISVYSEMNQGSSFKVFIPIAKDEERKNTGHPSGGSGRTIARMAKHYQVMVVDDEEMIRKMLKRTLEQMGLSVTTFNNGKTALSAYLENSSGFDLIITDQTMPEMVGTNLAHAVRETNQKIPIIIASGNISIITEEEIKAASPLKLLSKPIQISELKRIIAEALDLEATVVKKEL
jgi:PAS domain S-box-containing protein